MSSGLQYPHRINDWWCPLGTLLVCERQERVQERIFADIRYKVQFAIGISGDSGPTIDLVLVMEPSPDAKYFSGPSESHCSPLRSGGSTALLSLSPFPS